MGLVEAPLIFTQDSVSASDFPLAKLIFLFQRKWNDEKKKEEEQNCWLICGKLKC